jgi:hypothetical protein
MILYLFVFTFFISICHQTFFPEAIVCCYAAAVTAVCFLSNIVCDVAVAIVVVGEIYRPCCGR